MRVKMDLGGASYELDPAAISAIRYRAEYGDSIVNHLATTQTTEEFEGHLLRMCHCMIPEANRPELLDFARQARRDEAFVIKALAARDALWAVDPRWEGETDRGGALLDEYDVLALMAVANLDMRLIYELPIMHIVAIAGRRKTATDPDHVDFHPMTSEEMSQLYPRAKR